jgi:sigma-E factor negative regulatory protein RseA
MNSEVMKIQESADAMVAGDALGAAASVVASLSVQASGQEAPANDFEQISALADGELPVAQVAALLARSQQDTDLRAAWHGYQLIGDVLRAGAGPAHMGFGHGPVSDRAPTAASGGAASSSAAFLANFHAGLAAGDAQLSGGAAQSAGVLTSSSPHNSPHNSPHLAVRSGFDTKSSQRPIEPSLQTSVLPSIVPSAQAANDSVFHWKLASGFASMAAVAAIGWGAVSSGFLGLGDAAQTMARNASSNTAPISQQSSQANANSSANTVAAAGSAAPEATTSQSGDAAAAMQRDPRFEAYLAAHKQFGGASALAQPAGLLRSASFEAGR